MTTTKLLNLPVLIVVSDPWEFGTECGTGPFFGPILDATNAKLLVRFSKPVNYQGKTLLVALGQCRHIGDSLEKLSEKPMAVNLVLLPEAVEKIAELNPEKDREGVAVIATIQRAL